MALAPGTTAGAVAPPPRKPPERKPAPAPTGDHAYQGPIPRPPEERGPRPKPTAPQGENAAPQTFPGQNPITGPPVKPLQALGYFGSIIDFNRRLQLIHDAWTTKFGQPAPPGVALDVARSNVHDDHLPGLIQAVPASDGAARTQGILAQQKRDNPQDFFQVRPDGVLVQNNPLLDKFRAVVTANPLTVHEQYPNVQMGMLPLDMTGLFGSIQRLDKWAADGTIKVTDQGIDLSQFQKDAKTAADAPQTGQPPASYAGMSNIESPQTLKRDKVESARQAVQTVKDAQDQLNTEMGTRLPVTGFFNQTWVAALNNWMKSGSYFRSITKYQAQKAGFGDNTAAYMHAWRSKQDNVRKHGMAAQFLNAMPLQLFGHGLRGEPAAIFHYIVKGSSPTSLDFYTTMPLHSLTHSAGLTLAGVGGTVLQAKADAAAGNQFLQTMYITNDYDAAKAKARAALRANPTWLRAFYPDLPEHEHGILAAVDQVTNIAGDLILLRKANFTGERIAAGDTGAAMESQYVNAASRYAYTYLERGQLGRAASMLEGGSGAERLVTAAAKGVAKGTLTREQFTNRVAELYSDGRTAVPGAKGATTVEGPLLSSLRTRNLPTPGKPGMAWVTTKGGLRTTLDQFDQGLRGSGMVGTDNAANLLSSVRATFNHVAGRATSGYFDDRLPEAVYNFTLREFKDAKLANQMESVLIRARATQNVRGIQMVQRKLERLYAEKYPAGRGPAQDPFEAVLSTEAPVYFKFPAGGEKKIDSALGRLQQNALGINRVFNKLARIHGRIILSGAPIPGGGFSLFWKHAIGDTIRRGIGGGLSLRPFKMAKSEIDALAASDPSVERALGTFRARVEAGETRWALGQGITNRESFQTGDHFGLGGKRWMDAAGEKLRGLVTDKALTAYQRSTAGDLTPIVNLILHDRDYQGLWKSAKAADPSLSAEDYAALVHERFKEFEDAATAANVPDPFTGASNVLRANRGRHAGEALGKWIKDNKIDMPVHSGQVQNIGTLDSLSSNYIGNVIMAPNKWNRGRFADNILHKTYTELRAAGIDPKQAVDVGMDVAAKQARYHMLDFANQLQIEQDLRWISYFATKHRLYWKWVIGTFVRKPGIAAAVEDFRDHLDPSGNIPLTVHGMKLAIPAARLMWVPGKEYSEVSPLAGAGLAIASHPGDWAAGFQAATGTFGNVLTRSDTAIRLSVKLAKGDSTYGQATAGMDAATKARTNRALNEYQTNYYAIHGHYAPEADAVHHVLWAATAEELWRANLPLPVLPSTDRSDEQKQLAAFMALVDPAKRRAYLEKHPGLSDHFGVYQDPHVYLHNRSFFARYTKALDDYRAARRTILDQAKQGGMTGALTLRKRALDKKFQTMFQGLLMEDAKTGGGTIVDGQIVKKGSWGRVAAADPQLDPRHVLNSLFPNLKAAENFKVFGQLQKNLQAELNQLNDPQYAATYPDPQELKTRKREILQQLDAFRNYPTDALGKVQADYQEKYVNPFWAESDKRYKAIQALPRQKQDAAYAAYRAWRDAQDKPVMVGGVKFPSPLQMAWATLDPVTKRERLARVAASNWDHLADYEKTLLGLPPAPGTSHGWQLLGEFMDAAKKKMPAGERLPSGYRLTLAKYVNRYYDHGFLKDFHFANEPAYRRLQLMHVTQESPHAAEWSELLGAAKAYDRAYGHSDAYSHAAVQDTWRRYVDSSIAPWVAEHPQFKRELVPYGPDFLYSLVSP